MLSVLWKWLFHITSCWILTKVLRGKQDGVIWYVRYRDVFGNRGDGTPTPACLEQSWFTLVAPSLLTTPLVTLRSIVIWTTNSTISLLRAQAPQSCWWQGFPSTGDDHRSPSPSQMSSQDLGEEDFCFLQGLTPLRLQSPARVRLKFFSYKQSSVSTVSNWNVLKINKSKYGQINLGDAGKYKHSNQN